MGSCFSKRDSQQKTLSHHDHRRDGFPVTNGVEEIGTVLPKCSRSSSASKPRPSFDFDLEIENRGNLDVAQRGRNNSREKRASKSPVGIARTNSMMRKMVSVPATDNITGGTPAGPPAKRSAAYHSAANQAVSSSRGDTRRKALQSPPRRNPLAEIDSNAIVPQKLKSSTMKLDNRNGFARSRSQSSQVSFVEPEVPTNSSYTELLLQDIQNFHQSANPQPCMTKGRAKTKAVTGLNSTTSKDSSKLNYTKLDQFLESEVISSGDDLTQPSFCKYVTLGMDSDPRVGAYSEHRKSFQSNILPGYQQQLMSACWEPISSSRSIGRQHRLPVLGGKRLSQEQKNGVRKGRIVTP